MRNHLPCTSWSSWTPARSSSSCCWCRRCPDSPWWTRRTSAPATSLWGTPRCPWAEILFQKHGSSIFRQSSTLYVVSTWWNRLGSAVLPTENWLGSSMNHIQGWMTVWKCYCNALEKGCLSLRWNRTASNSATEASSAGSSVTRQSLTGHSGDQFNSYPSFWEYFSDSFRGQILCFNSKEIFMKTVLVRQVLTYAFQQFP